MTDKPVIETTKIKTDYSNYTSAKFYYQIMKLTDGLSSWVLTAMDSGMISCEKAQLYLRFESYAKLFIVNKLYWYNIGVKPLPDTIRNIAIAFSNKLEFIRNDIFSNPILLETLPSNFADFNSTEIAERQKLFELYKTYE